MSQRIHRAVNAFLFPSERIGAAVCGPVRSTLRRLRRAAAPVLERLETRINFGDYGPQGPGYTAPGCSCDGTAQTDAPVKDTNGQPVIHTTDLSSDAFGQTFSHTRSWAGYNNSSLNGNGWSVDELPTLIIQRNNYRTFGSSDTAIISVTSGGAVTDQFRQSSPTSATFVNTYDTKSTLVYQPPTTVGSTKVPGQFVFTDAAGDVTTFYDLPRSTNSSQVITDGSLTYGALSYNSTYYQEVTSQWCDTSTGVESNTATTPYQAGAFKSFTSASTNLRVETSYTFSGGKVATESVIRTDGSGAYERFYYQYADWTNPDTGASGRLLQSVTLQQGRGSSGYNSASVGRWANIRGVTYGYYTGDVGIGVDDQSDGRLGDLKLVTVIDYQRHASGDTVSHDYYRYYKLHGYLDPHGDVGPTNHATSSNDQDTLGTGGADATFPGGEGYVWSGLKAVVEGSSFARLVAAHPDYEALPDIDSGVGGVETFADHMFWYERVDGSDIPLNTGEYLTIYRVIQESATGEGCTVCSDGIGLYKYTYEDTRNASEEDSGVIRHPNPYEAWPNNGVIYEGGSDSVFIDTNSWIVRTYEYLPDTTNEAVGSNGLVDDSEWADNDVEITYTNELGQRMMTERREMATSVAVTHLDQPDGSNTLTVTASGHQFKVGDLVEFYVPVGDGIYDAATSKSRLLEAYDGALRVASVASGSFTVDVGTAPSGFNVSMDVSGEDVSAVRITADVYRYDAIGRQVAIIHDSALKGFNAELRDLVHYGMGVSTVFTGNADPDDAFPGYVYADQGLIDSTDYSAGTSGSLADGSSRGAGGDVAGYLQAQYVQKGQSGARQMVFHQTYFAHTAQGTTTYPVAQTISIWDRDGDGTIGADEGTTTQYSYEWSLDGSSNPTQQPSRIQTFEQDVDTSRNGGGTTNSVTDSRFDSVGRPTWTKNPDGSIDYTAYDAITGAVIESIVDVDTADTSEFSGLPSGWSNTSGTNLVTSYRVDGLGRDTRIIDPNGHVTYIVYDDAAHEVRTYSGATIDTNGTSGTMVDDLVQVTAPVSSVREDWSHHYDENATFSSSGAALAALIVSALTRSGTTAQVVTTIPHQLVTGDAVTISNASDNAYNGTFVVTVIDPLTFSYTVSGTPATPATPTSGMDILATVPRPAGTEAITTSAIQSLSRKIFSDAGQVIETDRYFSLPTGSYNTSSEYLGTSGASDANYLAVKDVYDGGTRIKREVRPDGTIKRFDYDANGRLTKEGMGTDDSIPGPSFWDFDYVGTDANIVQTAAYTYDDDGNLTSVTRFTGDASGTQLVTHYEYDYRDRLIGQMNPDGTGLRYTLDNQGNRTKVETFANLTWTGSEIDFGTPVSGVNAKLRGETTAAFDDRGLIYRKQTFNVNPSTGVVGDSLQKDYWYDAMGRLIKEASANGLFTKNTFDGAGRVIASYVSYNTGETAYSAADNVDGDTVLSQQQTFYLGTLPVITANYQRTAGSPDTGALSPSNSFLQASITWYDAAGRPVGTGNYGRDAGSVLLDSSGVPVDGNSDGVPDRYAAGVPSSLNAAYILNKTAYGVTGQIGVTTDNLGRETHYGYDLLGRETSMVENYDNGTVAASDTDRDRTTVWEYDGWGRLYRQKAYNADGASVTEQDTYYFYSSDIDRSWISYVIYPDSSVSVPTDLDWDSSGKGILDTGSDFVHTDFDRLGRKFQMTDQRGVEHAYTYNAAGQSLADTITSFGTTGDVDDATKVIQTGYDDVGRVATITSYGAYESDSGDPNYLLGTGAPLNQVAYTYDGWGNIVADQQASSGAVTGSTPSVAYTYDDGAGAGTVAKYVRLSKVTYPNGREVFYLYGPSGDTVQSDNADDRLSRIYEVGGDSSDTSSTYDVRYGYIGTGTIVRETHANGASKLDYDTAGDGSLTGLDTFGRVSDQKWTSAATSVSPAATTDDFQYTYDGNSNRTAIAGLGYSDQYTYDGLDRLTSYDRRVAGSGSFSSLTPIEGQAWTLDALGNWSGFTEDDNGDGTDDLTQTRTFDAANEITSISGGSWADTTYDDAGNMTAMPTPGNATQQEGAVYDAWNRMVKVTQPGTPATTIATYSYDGLGRRITSNESGHTEHDYFNENWQVLETRTDSATTPTTQNIWSERYIDALVREDRASTAAAGSVDTTFGGGDGLVSTDVQNLHLSDTASHMVVQPDGKILVAGWSITGGTVGDLKVVRYNVDGSLDSGFGTSGVYSYGTSSTSQKAYSIMMDSQGRFLVVGLDGSDTVLLRLNANGTPDTSFGPSSTPGRIVINLGGTDVGHDIAIDSSGKILVCGSSSTGGGIVARFLANGSALDTTGFGTSGIASTGVTGDVLNALAIDASGNIVAVGTSSSQTLAVRFTPLGVLDSTFGTAGSGKVIKQFTSGMYPFGTPLVNEDHANDAVIDANGKILITGTAQRVIAGTYNAQTMYLWRLNNDGTPDTSFSGDGNLVYDINSGATSDGQSLSLQADGKILVGGAHSGNSTLWRYNANGTLDTGFNSTGLLDMNLSSTGSELYTSVAMTWDNKIVLAGWAHDGTTPNNDFVVARLHGDPGLTQTLYYQQDANFNVTSVTTPTGAAVERYRYTPYGARTALDQDFTPRTNPAASNYAVASGFQGGQVDHATGLMLSERRLHSTTLGRWITRDPAGYVDGMSLYQFVHDRPTTEMDPSGLAGVGHITPGGSNSSAVPGLWPTKAAIPKMTTNSNTPQGGFHPKPPPPPPPFPPLPTQKLLDDYEWMLKADCKMLGDHLNDLARDWGAGDHPVNPPSKDIGDIFTDLGNILQAGAKVCVLELRRLIGD